MTSMLSSRLSRCPSLWQQTFKSHARARNYASGSLSRSSSLKASTIVLGVIPIFTFALGVWQIKRLRWKVALIEGLEDKLAREEMILPRKIKLVLCILVSRVLIDSSPEVVPEFEYRRVKCFGVFDHSKEILLGPKRQDNSLGYNVITPLVRDEGASTILVNRGFVAREKADQKERPASLVCLYLFT